MKYLYKEEVLSKLPVDPLGAAFFLNQKSKDAVYELVPSFRPDDKGNPSPHAHLFCITLGLPRVDKGIPFASSLISRTWHNRYYVNPQWRDHSLTLKKWVEEINEDSNGLISIHFTPADIDKHEARMIDKFDIDPELQDVLFGELLSEGMVDLASNKKLSRYALEASRRERFHQAQAMAASCEDPEHKTMLEYLNSLPMQLFVNHPDRLMEAKDWANKKYSPRDEDKHKHQLAHAGRMLRRTELFMRPLYQTSPLTPRLNPFGAGLLGLPTPMRHILRPDDIEIDLVSAHPSIFAAIFRLPLLLNALNENILYVEFAIALGPGWTADKAKEVLKQNAILPLFYGSEDSQIIYRLKLEGINEDAISRFMAHPITAEIRSARDELILQIIHEGGIHGAKSHWFSIIDVINHKQIAMRENGTWVGGNRAIEGAARSVLALAIQSFEWELMKPVREAALTSEDFYITAWQHDGCSLHFKRAGRENKTLDSLTACVKYYGEQLGINTTLKVKVE